MRIVVRGFLLQPFHADRDTSLLQALAANALLRRLAGKALTAWEFEAARQRLPLGSTPNEPAIAAMH
jgi:hypothetical protein